ncbi:MAG: hypothetical protein ACXABK_06760, partial [Candidatus Heimdallarchaeaceae archaeon]
MRTISKILIVGLIAFLVFSSTSLTLADREGRVENREGSVFIETSNVIVKLHAGKPDIFFWSVRQETGRRRAAIFHVSFQHVAELFGDDLIVDSRQELQGGKIYNLASDQLDWTLTNITEENHIQATLVSEPIVGGATITFAFHLFLEDTVVTYERNGTVYSYEAKALSEVKFDIVVDNWEFTPEATGLIFHVKIHEMEYQHRVHEGDHVNNPENDIRMNHTGSTDTNKTHETQ